MRVSQDKPQFEDLFSRAFEKEQQLRLEWPEPQPGQKRLPPPNE
jgi:hypothetical protein